MAMGTGGVIGQALLGGLQGAGNAAAYVGKSQYDSEMAAKQAEADQRRKKDLIMLQDQVAGDRHAKTVNFDQGFKEDTGKRQGAEVENAYQQAVKDYKLKQIQDNNDDPTITHDTAAPEEYDAVSGPGEQDALGMRATIQQKLGYHDQAKDTLAQQNTLIARQRADTNDDHQASVEDRNADQFDISMAHSRAMLASADRREASQASREQLQATRDAAKTANVTVSQLMKEKADFQKSAAEQAMLGGKSPEALKQQEENKLKLAAYDKEIANTRSYAMSLQKRLAANGYDSEDSSEVDSATAAAIIKSAQSKTAPTAPSAPAKPSTDTPKPEAPAPRVISEAIGAKPLNISPEAENVGVKLDEAKKTLSDIRSQRAPGLSAGRAAIDSYNQKLEQARQAVKDLSSTYETLVTKSIGR